MIEGLGRFIKGTAKFAARRGAVVVEAGERVLGSRSGKTLLIGGALAAGFSGTKPVENITSNFETKVMGDPNFSRRLLGKQMNLAGILSTANLPPGGSGFLQGEYMSKEMLRNASTVRGISSSLGRIGDAPGSMVFGMHNSRMG